MKVYKLTGLTVNIGYYIYIFTISPFIYNMVVLNPLEHTNQREQVFDSIQVEIPGDSVNQDVYSTLLFDTEILSNFNKLQEWVRSQNNSIGIRDTVVGELSNMGFDDKFSIEKLTKGEFIASFKDNPYIKYYFLRKNKFHNLGKFFTISDISRADINNFIDGLGIEFFSDDKYKELARKDLEEIGINSIETFNHYNFQSGLPNSIRDSLGFRYLLEKKFDIEDIYKTNSKKTEIANYLFSDSEIKAIDELKDVLNDLGIINFTQLLEFVYLKNKDRNINILEHSLDGLTGFTKSYFSSIGINITRIRGKSGIDNFAKLLGFYPEVIEKYRNSLIDRIKDTGETISNMEYDLELNDKLITRQLKNNKFFGIYFYYFISEGKGVIRNLDEEMKNTICDDFGIIQLEKLSDGELRENILKIMTIEEFSKMDIKSFINNYKDSPYIREYFRRKQDLGGISRLRIPMHNKFLSFICEKK